MTANASSGTGSLLASGVSFKKPARTRLERGRVVRVFGKLCLKIAPCRTRRATDVSSPDMNKRFRYAATNWSMTAGSPRRCPLNCSSPFAQATHSPNSWRYFTALPGGIDASSASVIGRRASKLSAARSSAGPTRRRASAAFCCRLAAFAERVFTCAGARLRRLRCGGGWAMRWPVSTIAVCGSTGDFTPEPFTIFPGGAADGRLHVATMSATPKVLSFCFGTSPAAPAGRLSVGGASFLVSAFPFFPFGFRLVSPAGAWPAFEVGGGPGTAAALPLGFDCCFAAALTFGFDCGFAMPWKRTILFSMKENAV